MRLHLLQLAAVSAAFVLPSQLDNFEDIEIQTPHSLKSAFDRLPSKVQVINDLEHTFDHVSEELRDTYKHVKEELDEKKHEFESWSRSALDDALSSVDDIETEVVDTARDAQSSAREWLNAATTDVQKSAPLESVFGGHGKPPGVKTNLTVYQLISESKYSTTLAKLINEFDDLVEALNGTAANYTVFAPTDKAFAKLPKHHKPSKEFLKALLSYHVSAEFFPVSRILVSRTIPTIVQSAKLGGPQRLTTNIGYKGLTINFLSRAIPKALNIFGTNGVVHGIDFPIFPPPNAATIITLLPAYLSTLELGLIKTDLFDVLNGTDNTYGGTVFAPSNRAFEKLGPKINAFLFSRVGLKYLKAILKYHLAPERVLYTDAYYKKSGEEDLDYKHEMTKVPKGKYHVDLPTALKYNDEQVSLNVDVLRYGRLIAMKVDGFAKVLGGDGVAEDGVIHVVNNVLIPPKKLDSGEQREFSGDLEEFIERVGPYVEDECEEYWVPETEELK